ncbi:hypothetical protein QF001_000578 [Paraburkholderia youngii]
MAISGMSLRSMVQDWLAPDPKRGFRVSHYERSSAGRYVWLSQTTEVGQRRCSFFVIQTANGAFILPVQRGLQCTVKSRARRRVVQASRCYVGGQWQ